MGTAGFACPSLAALADSPLIELIGVVTQPDRPKGRQLIPHPPAVKVEAETMKPKKGAFAPKPAAKRGRRGVLPIW